jgi:hypothetical protein
MAMTAAVLAAGAKHAIYRTEPHTPPIFLPPPTPPSTIAVAAPKPPPPPNPDTAAYWGPRLWRIFHTLAEYSDRRDISALWLNVLRTTAQVIPCTKCRTHLMEYLRTHTMFRFTPLMPIKEIHTTIRNDLYNLHNTVNTRNRAPRFDATLLRETYGTKPRPERMYEVQILYNELKNAWMPLLHTRIHPAAYSQWKQALELLMTLISSGPQK